MNVYICVLACVCVQEGVSLFLCACVCAWVWFCLCHTHPCTYTHTHTLAHHPTHAQLPHRHPHTRAHKHTHTHHDPKPIIMAADISFPVSMANEREATGKEMGRKKERGCERRMKDEGGDRKRENRWEERNAAEKRGDKERKERRNKDQRGEETKIKQGGKERPNKYNLWKEERMKGTLHEYREGVKKEIRVSVHLLLITSKGARMHSFTHHWHKFMMVLLLLFSWICYRKFMLCVAL